MTQDERKGLILCLKIEFSDGLWGDPAAASEAAAISGNILTLKPGGYIYEIVAEWNPENGYGGTASYFIYIKLTE